MDNNFKDETSKWSAALTYLNERVQLLDYDPGVDSLLARLSGIMLTHIDKECWDDILLSAAYGENSPVVGCPCDLKDENEGVH